MPYLESAAVEIHHSSNDYINNSKLGCGEVTKVPRFAKHHSLPPNSIFSVDQPEDDGFAKKSCDQFVCRRGVVNQLGKPSTTSIWEREVERRRRNAQFLRPINRGWPLNVIQKQLLEHRNQIQQNPPPYSSHHVYGPSSGRGVSHPSSSSTTNTHRDDSKRSIDGNRIGWFISCAHSLNMIHESFHYGIPVEVVAVCACMQVSPLFVQFDDPIQKQKQGIFIKALNQISSSDPFAYLMMFAHYVSVNQCDRDEWCVRHFIDKRKMKRAVRIAHSILSILATNSEVSDEFRFDGFELHQFRMDLAEQNIPSLFLKNFSQNIAIRDGLSIRSYFDLNTSSHLKISSTCIYSVLEDPPKYVVYAESSNTITTLMAVDEEFLPNGVRSVMLAGFDRHNFIPLDIRIGLSTKEYLFETFGQFADERFDGCTLNDDLKDDVYGRMQLLIPKRRLSLLSNLIDSQVRSHVQRLTDETHEFHMNNCNYKVSIGAGGLLKAIKLQSDASDSPRIRTCSSSEWAISERDRYTIQIRWYRRKSLRIGHVKLPPISQQELNDVARLLSESYSHFQFSYQIFRVPQIEFYGLDEGTTSQQLRTVMIPILKAVGIRIPSQNVYVLRSRRYPCEDGRKLYEYQQRISSYFEKIAQEKRLLSEQNNNHPMFAVGDAPQKRAFDVEVLPVENEWATEMFAYVYFKNLWIGQTFYDAIVDEILANPPLSMGEVYINSARMKGFFELGVRISKRLLNILLDELEELRTSLHEENEIDLKWVKMIDSERKDESDSGSYIVVVTGSDYDEVREVRGQIEKMVNGIVLDCSPPQTNNIFAKSTSILPYSILLRRDEISWLKDMEYDMGCNHIIITVLPMQLKVQFQGSTRTITEAKRRIDEHLRKWTVELIERDVIIRAPNYESGILNAFLKKRQNLLLRCWSSDDAHQSEDMLSIDYFNYKLRFCGTGQQYDKLIGCLNEIDDSLGDENGKITDCSICLKRCLSEAYCLESCGHYACLQCIKVQFEDAFSSCNLPMKCARCGSAFVWKDFEVLLMGRFDRRGFECDENCYSAEELQRIEPLLNAALNNFMNLNMNEYRHCDTIGCQAIYKITKGSEVKACELCGCEVCRRCGNKNHEAISCDEYIRMKVNNDLSIRYWMSQDSENRRVCPNKNCQMVIQKTAGCNHMHCKRCSLHFCWLCGHMAETPGPIYRHLHEAHGGWGLPMDGINFEEDEPEQLGAMFFVVR